MLVDCRLVQPNSSHLRPMYHTLFLCACQFPAPKRLPTTASTNPLPGAWQKMHPPVCAAYSTKQTVQSILLFERGETWNLSPKRLKCLEGFHLQANWRMAGKRPMKLRVGTWKYPNLTAVLDKVGLKSITHYIGVRRQHIAIYIVDKPIFRTHLNGVRRCGSSVRQFWWAQPMDLEMAWAAWRLAGPVVISDDEGD